MTLLTATSTCAAANSFPKFALSSESSERTLFGVTSISVHLMFNSIFSEKSPNRPKNKSLISSVSKEVKVYSVEQHISKLSDQMLEKWEELNSKINELEGIELNPKKHYISLALDGSSFSTICYIKFGKSKIKLSIIRGVENYFSFDDPKGIAGDWQRILNNGKTQKAYEINIDSKSDLDYIMFLVKQKYNSLTE